MDELCAAPTVLGIIGRSPAGLSCAAPMALVLARKDRSSLRLNERGPKYT